MKVTATLFLVLVTAVFSQAFAQSHSKYVGQDQRAIKSLSAKDVAELRRGGGWGFAKTAELNGIPGPLHLLEMTGPIALTSDQVAQITAVYDRMRSKAKTLGQRFIELEQTLDRDFRNGTISNVSLPTRLQSIAEVRAKLRGVHLEAHLKVRPLLSAHQVSRYNQLRGYSNPKPCASPPKGHDIALWREHNSCE